MEKTNKQTNKKHKQLRKSYLENHNYDPSRAKCSCCHWKWGTFLVKWCQTQNAHTPRNFFPITSARGSKTNRANKKRAVSFEVIDEHRLNRGVEALLQIELTSNCLNMGRKNMLFQWTKKITREGWLCTWRFKRDLWEFPDGIVINYRRKEVNQCGSAPFAKEWHGRRG